MRFAPAQSADGRPVRLVFTSDPAGVADRVEETQQKLIIDFTGAWLVVSGIIGGLHMRDLRQMRPDRVREFVVEHREIRGKLWHGGNLVRNPDRRAQDSHSMVAKRICSGS